MKALTDFFLVWQHLIHRAQHEQKLLDKVVAAEKRYSEQYQDLISIREKRALRTRDKWLLEKEGSQLVEERSISEREKGITEIRDQILQLRRSETDAEYLVNEAFMEWILAGIANSNTRKTRLKKEIDRALERANKCQTGIETARDQLGKESAARLREQHEYHAEQLQTILDSLTQRRSS